MRTDLFAFDLPVDRIALRPARPRDHARLLVVRPTGPFEDRTVGDLPDLLHGGDQVVLNDTKVIPVHLRGRRIGRNSAEPRIEATLHHRLDGSRWLAFVKPARKLACGDAVRFGAEGRVCLLAHLDAMVEAKGEGGEVTLGFGLHGPVLDQAISDIGEMPLPPYIAARRAADANDRTDYQTIFARDEGSVAAPTAGLHFTPTLLAGLSARAIGLHYITLHIGAGTFRPVTVDDTERHQQHPERGVLTAETAAALERARSAGGRIVAVGSTVVRLLETAVAEDGQIRPMRGETALFITPGYRFRAVDAVLTNFHLPRSTLFMLVCGFLGLARMQQAYAHAIAAGYRFYSYGDGCLLLRDG